MFRQSFSSKCPFCGSENTTTYKDNLSKCECGEVFRIFKKGEA